MKSIPIPLATPIHCSCDVMHKEIPEDAAHCEMGLTWDCSKCKSSKFVPWSLLAKNWEALKLENSDQWDHL